MNQDPHSSSPHAQIAFDDLVARNVEAINRIERAASEKRTRGDRVTDAIAHFCGTRAFLFVHCVCFGGWLLWNGYEGGSKRVHWDPPPFNTLSLVVGLEAIFLTTFILMSQNRQQRTAEQRNHLELQINMLAEQESSQMLGMMRKMMEHFGIPLEGGGVPGPLEHATDAERLAVQIEEILDVSKTPEDLTDPGNEATAIQA